MGHYTLQSLIRVDYGDKAHGLRQIVDRLCGEGRATHPLGLQGVGFRGGVSGLGFAFPVGIESYLAVRLRFWRRGV